MQSKSTGISHSSNSIYYKLDRSNPFKIMNYIRISTIILLACHIMFMAAQKISIIPQPKKVEIKQGEFLLTEKTKICYNDPQLKDLAVYTSTAIKALDNIQLLVQDSKGIKPKSKITTQLTGKQKASLLASNQKLKYKPVEGGIVVTIPKQLRAELVKKEAVVVKIVK